MKEKSQSPSKEVRMLINDRENVELTLVTAVQSAGLSAPRHHPGSPGVVALVLGDPGGGHGVQLHPGSSPCCGHVLQKKTRSLPGSSLPLCSGSGSKVNIS